jgi:predicted nucleotidyltransferase component of viral defense system
MLNKEKHQLIMGQILKDIYTDTLISSLLGFKGGTCAYFFYELDRFSVDLDFDLIQVSKENKEKVFERIIFVLNKYGEVENKHIKRYTLFALLSYGDEDRNIKIEINTRGVDREYYEIKDYIGIPILVAKKDYLFSSKLVALPYTLILLFFCKNQKSLYE